MTSPSSATVDHSKVEPSRSMCCASRVKSVTAGKRSEHDGLVLVDQDAVLEMPAHRAGEHDALDVAPDVGERARVVAVGHALDVLLDDRAVIELLGDVVGGRADDLHPPLRGPPVGVGAGE